jgi:hypothetical protein
MRRLGGHHRSIRCLPARVCRSLLGLAESVLAAEISFGGLNRCVSKQELNLLKRLMGHPTGICIRAMPVVLTTMRKRGTAANSREGEPTIPPIGVERLSRGIIGYKPHFWTRDGTLT